MKLLYISCYQFMEIGGGVQTLPAYNDTFWEKYLDVFDSVYVLGEQVKSYLNNGTMAVLKNPKISVEIIKSNTHPKDFKNDKIIFEKLDKEIKKAEAILIKPSSRKGMMAISLAEKYNKPYMIELTGDLKLSLSTHKNILKRLYASILHRQIISTIKNAPFGLYVTESYLQNIYPIFGKQCGASDVFIKSISVDILEQRFNKINSLNAQKELNIGLIGSYHDTRKGIDTAIKAIARIHPNVINAQLNILALGTEKDRQKWLEFAKKYDVADKVNFPSPCDTTQKVLEWIDTQDILILPSRSEGLPRCIVEAMSRGCPCITSNVCGMPELINKKWLHKPGDEKMLTKLIIDMLEDKYALYDAAQENFNNAHYFLRDKIKERRNKFLREFKDYCIGH